MAGTDTAAEDTPSKVPGLGTGGQLTQAVELLAFLGGFLLEGLSNQSSHAGNRAFLSRLFLLKEVGWTGAFWTLQ